MEIPRIIKAEIGTHDHIRLYGLSDWHLGSEYCDRKALQKTINAIQTTPSAYCVLLGDMMDNALKGSVSNVYMSTMNPQSQINEAANILQPIKDKILAITEGNHEARTIKEVGILPMYILALKLGLDVENVYSVGAFVLFLRYGNALRTGRNNVFSIYCKHGSGGGGTVGGKANAMDKMKADIVADVYISAHTHQQLAFMREIYIADKQKQTLVSQKSLFVNSGSFLSWGGYAVEKGFSPSPTGTPVIDLWTDRKRSNDVDRIDKHAAVTMGY